MKRVRISTTVDAELLEACRRLLGGPDSRMIDQALALLVDTEEGRQELARLAENPYDSDPEVSWTAPDRPDLPYDGDIPAEVARLAAQRRSRRSA